MRLANIFNRRGQATTEVVLLFPLFLIFIVFMAKIFALLVLVQKMEIASAYAAKRWQLESHSNIDYATGWDNSFLLKDIQKKVEDYIGFNNRAMKDFMSLRSVKVNIERTQVWNEVKITVNTQPAQIAILCKYDKQVVCRDQAIRDNCLRGYNYLCESGGQMEVKKFVPTRGRPVQFQLPVNKRK
ncbi:TadE family protein [Elusimicrobium minutum Pei191]|uniref:TadE family protein n=1 Tax=Elusimicrobium minutum (strain Pei191) TaxID=445932 RepID=B2KDZ8_ELUMP|nr:pilus assembly protein [Elusimicrobium minutum]ACC98744.1 TadE family protein [Elusimicrobium minutum Pei191]